MNTRLLAAVLAATAALSLAAPAAFAQSYTPLAGIPVAAVPANSVVGQNVDAPARVQEQPLTTGSIRAKQRPGGRQLAR